MTTQIISDTNFTDPGNLIPFLEKDDAIIRNATKGMFDFSNTACLPVAGAIASGQLATSLTVDASTGAAAASLPAVSGGLIDFGGVSKSWTLPNTFKLANTVKRFMVIVWAKLPASGYPTSGVSTVTLAGYLANTTNLAQWGVTLVITLATGLPNVFQIITPTSGTSASSDLMTNADTLALCDGNLHQIALYFDGESVAGQRSRNVYVDKVAKLSASSAWDGTFNTPAAGVGLGSLAGFQTTPPANYKLGRPSIWDLTGTTWTPAQVLQRDWDAAQGWLS